MSIASSNRPRNATRSGCSHIATAARPPGRSTRRSSRAARSGWGRWLTTKAASAASKLASANGSSSASPCRNSSRGWASRAARTIPSARSIPTGSAPRSAAAAQTCPGPQPTSSTRTPGPTPAASSSAPATCAVIRPVSRWYPTAFALQPADSKALNARLWSGPSTVRGRQSTARGSAIMRRVSASKGIVAAGHPITAEAGARVLREGGNAVDAAVGAVLASWVAEPLLTGPGAGGYLLVAGAGEEPTLLDFFVEAPGHGADASTRTELLACEVSFGDAVQIFNCGASSCGTYGMTAGLAAALARWGSLDLAALVEPAAAMAREGVALNAAQAYVFEILEPILVSTVESRAAFAPEGRSLREGDV